MWMKGFSVFKTPTGDVFVVSGDVLVSGIANSFGADEWSNLLRVFAAAHHPTFAHHDGVNVSVHFCIHKGDVVKKVYAAVLDCFDWSRAAAEDTYNERRRERQGGS